MSGLHRRDFLALGSAVLIARASAQQNPPATKPPAPPPPPPKSLPRAWLNATRVPVWPGPPPGATDYVSQDLPQDWSPVFVRNVASPDLHVFRPARSNGHALLVLPGGAYWFVSVANEGVDLAQRMNALGYTVFVLTYRLPGEGWKMRSDVPLQDAQRAMRVIRANAQAYGIHADKVTVLGFSAGGHLAATLATQHAEHSYEPVDTVDALSARPMAAGLVYPVVTMDAKWTHQKSRELLLGDTPSAAQVERRSAERHVDANTPPTFLIHALDDEAVPVENSLQFLRAMREARRSVEAHFLQEGGHAFGVGRPGTPSEQWIPLFSSWLGRIHS
jgi:acetyl esterase/lipase